MSNLSFAGGRQKIMKGWQILACTGLLLVFAGCAPHSVRSPEPPRQLKVATWNLEHLAESDGLGCRPRSEDDYAALRRHADRLDADVIAFQEVENAAAARRVFPADRYAIVMSTRPESGRSGPCRHDRTDGPSIRSQKVGFAIRNGLAFTRNPDLHELALGNPDLRWGVDVTLSGRVPLRLLAVHLKSGCSAGSDNPPCPVLFEQVPVLQDWVAARRAEGIAFAILGDWNRRLALADDPVWRRLNERLPAGSELVDAAGGRGATCVARYPDFIDHIVLDPVAAARRAGNSFEEYHYGVAEDQHPSDHCPVAVSLD